MGHSERSSMMETRAGSVSSRPGSSPGLRGQTSKSVPICLRSSSKLTHSIIKDHMISHYKKVYSAKAAIDASVPKSLTHSVKYNDQIRRSGRPQSAHSLSQRNSRASCSSAQSRLSAHYDDNPYLCSRSSRSSMDSSPRFNTSFNTRDRVYPSNKISLQNQHRHIRPASEMKYHSPESTLNRGQSACSLRASGDHSSYRTFQDPVQKTYSGDLLKKHSQHFTQDKPFTPKTLKSEKSSYLSSYRYYRAPRRKPSEDGPGSRLMRQETYHGRTRTQDDTQELYQSSQGFHTEREWSEDDLSGTCFSASGERSRANRSRDHELFYTSSRVSPEGGKSPAMKSISKEEEELMYLEFISAVTEDILTRAHISDRVLDQVMNRHMDRNRHYLDEDKMRHLLEVLRKEFEEPATVWDTTTQPELKENDLFHTLLPKLGPGREEAETRDRKNLFSLESLIKNGQFPDDTDPLVMDPPESSAETSASPAQTSDLDGGDDHFREGIRSSWLSELVPDNAELAQEDSHQNQTDISARDKESSNDGQECPSVSSDKAFQEDEAEVGCVGESKELDDLARSLSESLCVSSRAQHNTEETTEQLTNAAASLSDDEF